MFLKMLSFCESPGYQLSAHIYICLYCYFQFNITYFWFSCRLIKLLLDHRKCSTFIVSILNNKQYNSNSNQLNRIGGVMVSVLASSAVDRGFDPRSGQTKDYEIGMCCFSAKHAALRRKSKDWLTRNQNSVSEWGDMSTRQLLFQWVSTIKMQLSVLI